MYTKITDPYTGNSHTITSSKGRQIIQAYVSYLSGGANTKLQKQVKDLRRKVVRGRNKYQHGGMRSRQHAQPFTNSRPVANVQEAAPVGAAAETPGGAAEKTPSPPRVLTPEERAERRNLRLNAAEVRVSAAAHDSPHPPLRPIRAVRSRSAGDNVTVGDWHPRYSPPLPPPPLPLRRRRSAGDVDDVVVSDELKDYITNIRDGDGEITDIEKDEGSVIAQKLVEEHITQMDVTKVGSEELEVILWIQEQQLLEEEQLAEELYGREWGGLARRGIDDFRLGLAAHDTTPWTPEGQLLVDLLLVLPRAGAAGGRAVRDVTYAGGRFARDGTYAGGRFARDGTYAGGRAVRDVTYAGGRLARAGVQQAAPIIRDGAYATGRAVRDVVLTVAPIIRDGAQWTWSAIRAGIVDAGDRYQEWMARPTPAPQQPTPAPQQPNWWTAPTPAPQQPTPAPPQYRRRAAPTPAPQQPSWGMAPTPAPPSGGGGAPKRCPSNYPHYCPTTSTGAKKGSCIKASHALAGGCTWNNGQFGLTTVWPYSKKCTTKGKGDKCAP